MNIKQIALYLLIIMVTLTALSFIPLRPIGTEVLAPESFAPPEIVSGKKVVDIADVKKHWEMLTNNTYGYSIEYPYDLTPFKSNNSVSFQTDDYSQSVMGVSVWDADSIPAALLDPRFYRVERVIKQNGYEGTVTHSRGPTEEYPYEKTLRIKRGGKIYLINSRGLYFDHERVWRGVRFLE